MAERESFNSTERMAGRKLPTGFHNNLRSLCIRMPATYAQVTVADTIKTGMIIPAGARIKNVEVRNGTGTGSSTLDVGLRKASDGTVVDATALAALHPIATASGGAKVISGTKMAAGIDYVLADDCEVYLTPRGAVLAANQALQVDVDYAAP